MGQPGAHVVQCSRGRAHCHRKLGGSREVSEPELQFLLSARVVLGFRWMWPAAPSTGPAPGSVGGAAAALGPGGWGGYLQGAGGGGRRNVGIWVMESVPRPQARACLVPLGVRLTVWSALQICSFCGAHPGLPLSAADAQAPGQAKGAPLWPGRAPWRCHRSLPVRVEAGLLWAAGLLPWRGHPTSSAVPHPRASQMGGHGLVLDNLTEDRWWARAAHLPERGVRQGGRVGEGTCGWGNLLGRQPFGESCLCVGSERREQSRLGPRGSAGAGRLPCLCPRSP